ncbi:septum formation family protein [Nocardioides ungokensis]|uniref:septum formation family protein n=1 Tax=Nocardioides ungokensis TaxID=1643322 RepID=UPI0015DE5EBB|nr:septum formation family protein [Nocardioides ungokensis]
MNSTTGVRHALATVLTALATASVALVAAPAMAGTTTPDGPDYQAPTVGECRTTDLAGAYKPSDTSAPTDCAAPHTLRVIAVGHLPDGVAWSKEAAVEKAAAKICQPAENEALGRSYPVRDMSAYAYFWFQPTKDQRSHGARWIRCDLGLWGGAKILPLPTDETPALQQPPLPDKVARCLTPRTLSPTTCARKHAFRATGTFTVKSSTFPGSNKLNTAAARKCAARVSSDRYHWTYRLQPGWNAGDHVVVCYSKTKS